MVVYVVNGKIDDIYKYFYIFFEVVVKLVIKDNYLVVC